MIFNLFIKFISGETETSDARQSMLNLLAKYLKNQWMDFNDVLSTY